MPELVVNTSSNLEHEREQHCRRPQPDGQFHGPDRQRQQRGDPHRRRHKPVVRRANDFRAGGERHDSPRSRGWSIRTHFTIAAGPTSGAGAAAASFTSHTGLSKTGGGTLDLSLGNRTGVAFAYSGPLVVNGGLVLVNSDSELGAVPASFNPAAIVLNGGEIDPIGGTTQWSTNRGITVGPQGGKLSYAGTASAFTFGGRDHRPGRHDVLREPLRRKWVR